MGIRTKKIAIDGHDYEITMLGAIQGRRIWLKLLQLLAEPLKVLGKDSMSEATIAQALSAAIEGLDQSTMEELCTVFSARSAVRVGERWPKVEEIFDDHFAGRYVSMSKWLGECVLFNYASFLGDISIDEAIKKVAAMVKEAGQAAAEATASPSPSPKISIGPSGVSSPTSAPP